KAVYIKKGINKMSLSQVEWFIKDIIDKGIEEGKKYAYKDGIKEGLELVKEALKELYGFGDKRVKRIEDYINLKLEESK
ncbi:hypothetical protein, partial [Gottschalkia purinilytica]|uniref:hypothetical protein n=1 Tax=Gottschalkia purinilytica TaxID=1503 RepID=UPI001F217AE6